MLSRLLPSLSSLPKQAFRPAFLLSPSSCLLLPSLPSSSSSVSFFSDVHDFPGSRTHRRERKGSRKASEAEIVTNFDKEDGLWNDTAIENGDVLRSELGRWVEEAEEEYEEDYVAGFDELNELEPEVLREWSLEHTEGCSLVRLVNKQNPGLKLEFEVTDPEEMMDPLLNDQQHQDQEENEVDEDEEGGEESDLDDVSFMHLHLTFQRNGLELSARFSYNLEHLEVENCSLRPIGVQSTEENPLFDQIYLDRHAEHLEEALLGYLFENGVSDEVMQYCFFKAGQLEQKYHVRFLKDLQTFIR